MGTKVKELSGSEAVYGVLAFLTCLKEPITFGAVHDASIGAEIADAFCKSNGLVEPRDNWTDFLTHPEQPPNRVLKKQGEATYNPVSQPE